MSSPLFPQHVIARKRDGHALTEDEIKSFVRGATDGSWADYQLSALLMAICLRGMTPEETAHYTRAMMNSGFVADLSSVRQPKADKHSTGGVGDKVSLHLAPMIAACGVAVPMISGRGLGHTGGTLDKLESIPGFRVNLSLAEYRAQLERLGVCLIGQTAELAPADKKLYALRDVTGTVECIPLICASILSKKLAEGTDVLVGDVKFGRGAFMKDKAKARELAQALVSVSNATGTPMRAVLTAMDEPLGRAVGNTLEVAESIDCLKGRPGGHDGSHLRARRTNARPCRRPAKTLADARQQLEAVDRERRGSAKFPRTDHRPRQATPSVADDPADHAAGPVENSTGRGRIACRFYAGGRRHGRGLAALRLGAGRAKAEEKIDHAVGVSGLVVTGRLKSRPKRRFA